MDESGAGIGQTAVIGERELAIGFRLIGLQNVVDVTPATASAEFQRLMTRDDINLVVASEGVRRRLSENQRIHAEGSLQPLVVFVPSPTGEYEVESLATLAKRVLGISLQV
ncbi:MAG: V-type ATP synthase subunit F [Thermoplasmata archaeon]